jgi:putative ATP-dependent endonuclease of the OLD family
MSHITKIRLQNFKKFDKFEVDFDPKLNLLIGDNEAGKSTVLTAIDLAISGSRNKVETIGLEHLFNADTITNFLNSDRKNENLPILFVELFLNDEPNEFLEGKNNSAKKECNGLKFICKANQEFGKIIAEILKDPHCIFPFEFYNIEFITFSGQTFNSYTKCLKHIFIDNTQVSSEYAMKEYVKEIYNSNLSAPQEKYTHQHKYRLYKNEFKTSALTDINTKIQKIGNYTLGIKSNSKSNLETDLTIYEGSITIDNKGKGKQCIIKSELALAKNGNDLDIVLLEEPENHLSHLNTQGLINKISEADNKQIFIATHSDLISTRLDLRNCILLNSSSNQPIKLSDLSESTSKFFIKAPDNNILQFILSAKVVLVEGDAEFILMETFFRQSNNMELKASNVHIISVDGTSFERYLELAIKLNIKTAVISDNDGNYKNNITEKYSAYDSKIIQAFSNSDNTKSTFEICMYETNTEICENLFKEGRRTLSVQQYMLKNKAEVSFLLLDNAEASIVTPTYIIEALQWIIKD